MFQQYLQSVIEWLELKFARCFVRFTSRFKLLENLSLLYRACRLTIYSTKYSRFLIEL